MGYKTGGFGFSGEWRADDGATGHWLLDNIVVNALLEPIERDGYLVLAEQISVMLGDYETIRDLDDLHNRARAWDYDVINLIAGDPNDPDWLFHFGLDRVGPRVFVAV